MSNEFINCPYCGKLTTTVTGNCKHCGKPLNNSTYNTTSSNIKCGNTLSLILAILLVIGLVIVVPLLSQPKSDEATIKQALTMIDKYYEYYNDEDYNKIKSMLYDKDLRNNKKNKKFIEWNIKTAIKSRGESGRYLGYKYPDEPIKQINFPDTEDPIVISKSYAELVNKYGEHIFEDKFCLKNRYLIYQHREKKIFDVCITLKFENGENSTSFMFIKTPKELKIWVGPEYYTIP